MAKNNCYDSDCDDENCYNPEHYNYICFDPECDDIHCTNIQGRIIFSTYLNSSPRMVWKESRRLSGSIILFVLHKSGRGR